MNTPEHNVDKTAEHEGLIKTPKQLIITVILAFIVPIAVILLLIRLVTASAPLGAGSDAHSQEAVAKRIQPVAGFALVSADAAGEERTGEQVYSMTCAACHGTGVAGAPKLGDEAAWSAIIAKGFDAMVKNAINGINAMPPRGGNPNLTDLEVARAVAYLANEAGGNFPEPEGGAAEGEAAAESGGQASAQAAAGAEAPTQQEAAAQAEAAQTAVEATTGAPAEESQGADGQAQQAQAAEGQAQQAQAGQAQQGAADAQQSNAEAQTEAVQQVADAQETAAAADDIDLAAGEKLYNTACFACHNVGVAGAPKLGDKAVWQPLVEKGMDELIQSAIKGKGAMPPRGGSTASDQEVTAAVHYMVNASQ